MPSIRLRPLKVAKLNIGKPFYFAEDELKNDELENNVEQLTKF